MKLTKISESILCYYLRLAYSISLATLRRRELCKPVTVIFLVSEIAKWKAQSLYDLLASDNRFLPCIYVYPVSFEKNLDEEELRPILEDKKNFFSKKNMNVSIIWNYKKKDCYREFFKGRGLVFYQQPWDINPAIRPLSLSKRYLTFYIPYYLVNNYSYDLDLCMPLQSHVFRYIVQSPELEMFYNSMLKHIIAGKIIGLGHTITDCFKMSRTNFNYTVIYAPHFSLPNKKRDVIYSTFLSNGEIILDYAMKHQNIQWVFKPHPRLKRELMVSGLWSKEKIENYYSQWESIGKTCYSSDYQYLFVNSDLMITDCGSFLTEYSCTSKPIIRLISPHLNLEPNPMLENLYSTFYGVHNNFELLSIMDSLIVNRIDPQKEVREEACDRLGLCNGSAAENIRNYLVDLLRL